MFPVLVCVLSVRVACADFGWTPLNFILVTPCSPTTLCVLARGLKQRLKQCGGVLGRSF